MGRSQQPDENRSSASEDDSKAPSKRPFIVACVANVIIAAAKFVAAFVTGSASVTAEGVHSLVDAINNLLMLLGIRRSRRQPTRLHPFGFGKELYFWSLIVAMVFFGIGGGVSVVEGIFDLISPEPLGSPGWNYGVLGISLLADGASLVVAFRELERSEGPSNLWRRIRSSKDPTKFTVVLEDGAAVIGVFLAALGVFLTQVTGNQRYDAAGSVLIGCLLAVVALLLARESKDLLLGESAGPSTLAEIREIIEADDDVVEVQSLLTMHLAPTELLLNIDVRFADDLDMQAIARAVRRLEAKLQDQHHEISRIFIEARTFASRTMT